MSVPGTVLYYICATICASVRVLRISRSILFSFISVVVKLNVHILYVQKRSENLLGSSLTRHTMLFVCVYYLAACFFSSSVVINR